jgi:hypothetical protein
MLFFYTFSSLDAYSLPSRDLFVALLSPWDLISRLLRFTSSCQRLLHFLLGISFPRGRNVSSQRQHLSCKKSDSRIWKILSSLHCRPHRHHHQNQSLLLQHKHHPMLIVEPFYYQRTRGRYAQDFPVAHDPPNNHLNLPTIPLLPRLHILFPRHRQSQSLLK